MRRITVLVGTVGLLSAGAIGAIACGSDDATVPDATDSGATNTSSGGEAGTSSGGTSGATGTSSGGTSGTPADGGSSGTTSSGDLPPTPYQFTCGASTCDAGETTGPGPGENVCCVAADQAKTKCSTSFQCDNQGNGGNLRMACDESADCHDDRDICCYVKQGNQNPSFEARCTRANQCVTFTGGGPGGNMTRRPQLCHTSAECGDAGACNEKTCDGFKIHVCGAPAGCQ